jgi:alkylation response protein AidB-like acyl-CoA dehydrogenase
VTSLDAEELSALAAMADAFARAELGPRQAGLEDGDSIDPAIIAAFRAAGLWRLGLPEEAGGEGAGMAATLLVAQRLARGGSPPTGAAMIRPDRSWCRGWIWG